MSRRDQIRMTPEEIDAFLQEARTLQVASSNGDGSIHLVPMWFAVVDGNVAFWTYGKSQKIVNLRRDPRITVMVEGGDVYEQLCGVTITGKATIVEDRGSVQRCGERVYEKYWGPITDDVVRDGVAQMGAKRVAVVVAPEKVVSWDHSKLGGTY